MDRQIKRWKAQYGKIYRINVLKQDYIFRSLLMGEYHRVSQQDDPVEKERIILTCGVLYPNINLTTIPSGVAERLVICISQVTNITEKTITDKVQEKRDELGMTDDYLKWKCQMIKALNYKPEEIDNMTFDRFVEALVMAEEVLGAPLVAIGPEEEAMPQENPVDQKPQEEEQVVPLTKGGEIPRAVLETQADQTVKDLKLIYAREKKKRVVNG